MKFTYKGKYVFFILTSLLIVSVLLSILSVNNKNKTILIGNYYNCSEKINTTFISKIFRVLPKSNLLLYYALLLHWEHSS